MHVLKCALAQVLICNMHILKRYDRVCICIGLATAAAETSENNGHQLDAFDMKQKQLLNAHCTHTHTQAHMQIACHTFNSVLKLNEIEINL